MSDYIEHACHYCGSLLHHEDDCQDVCICAEGNEPYSTCGFPCPKHFVAYPPKNVEEGMKFAKHPVCTCGSRNITRKRPVLGAILMACRDCDADLDVGTDPAGYESLDKFIPCEDCAKAKLIVPCSHHRKPIKGKYEGKPGYESAGWHPDDEGHG